MVKLDPEEIGMDKKVFACGVRATIVAATLAAAMAAGMVSGCAADGSSVDDGKAVPEVATPLEPVAGSEPMQSFGGEDIEEGTE